MAARRDELDLNVGLVISNHPDLPSDVRAFGLPFDEIPVTPRQRSRGRGRQLELLAGVFDLS